MRQEAKKQMEAVFSKWLQKEQNTLALSGNEDAPRTPIGIDVYIHIVKPSENSTANEAMGLEHEQIKILTQSYVRADGSSAFVFNLVGVLTWVNSTWWNSSDDYDMVIATRQGEMSTLNVWFKNLTDKLGYATFPWTSDDNEALLDGVAIMHTTVYGGSEAFYSEGDTLVHEVGHWLGLYHSKMTNQSSIKDVSNAYFPQLTSQFLIFFLFFLAFRDGCNGGDLISDTPPEAKRALGCPVGRDTCPGGGVDPIHNL